MVRRCLFSGSGYGSSLFVEWFWVWFVVVCLVVLGMVRRCFKKNAE